MIVTPNPQLTIHDLVRGLEQFGGRYEALDVFADDLVELKTGQPVSGLRAADETGRRFVLSVGGKAYRLELFDEGVVRLRKTSEEAGVAGVAALGGGAGMAIGAAATTKKGEGAAAGLILGLLAGAIIGSATQQPAAPRRVFTLRFDPAVREWLAYDGALVGWMKQQLARTG